MTSDLARARMRTNPAGWPVYRLRHLARLTGGGTPSKDNPEYWSGGDILWVSPKDMKQRRIVDTEDYITSVAVDGSTTSFVDAGSVLLVVRSGILRHSLPVAIAGRRLTVNQDIKAFQFDDRVDSEFFAYWVEGQSQQLLTEWRQLGATVESIDTRWMMDGLIALPPIEDQRVIADFLDRETGRIDALIAKKERLVGLLRTRHAAEIEHTVMGRHVNGRELRPSGVDWIGSIPGHWAVRRVIQVARLESGHTPSRDEPSYWIPEECTIP